jgi:hypothetical protein
MRAFGQHFGELRELPEDDTTVPLDVRYVLAAVLVLKRRLCSKRERGKATVLGGANFWVAAEKTYKSDFVLVHESVSLC